MTASEAIQARLARPFDPAELRRVKRLWVRHSIAEDRRDIDGLIATLSPDCVYEIAVTGQEQARGLMYRTSLPDHGGMIFPMVPAVAASTPMMEPQLPGGQGPCCLWRDLLHLTQRPSAGRTLHP